MEFKVKSIYMENISKKMKKLEKKVKQYGGEFAFEIIDEVTEKKRDERGLWYNEHYTMIEVEGSAKNEGWEFIGTIEHHANGNLIKLLDTAADVPEVYYHSKPICEHCGTNRARKETYIVRNIETGEFKQVGKACLAEYTHGLNATWTAVYWEALSEIERADEVFRSDFGGGSAWVIYPAWAVVATAFAVVDKLGYAKSDRGEDSTKAKVFTFLHGTTEEWNSAGVSDIDVDKYRSIAEDAITWAQAYEGNNDFLRSLKILCSDEEIQRKNYGYIAALPNAYHRALKRKAEREENAKKWKDERSASEYVGEVKERIAITIAAHRVLTSWEGEYGFTYVNEFITNDGNVIIWKTSRGNFDGVKALKGTVKAHRDYAGIKQTEVTRCKILDI